MNEIFIKKDINNKVALKLLKKTGQKCLIVVDEKRRLRGTLSDGDLRNSILSGGFKGSIKNFYNKKPIFFYQNNINFAEAKKYFLKENITVIPIINKKSKKIHRIITPRSLLKKFDKIVLKKPNLSMVIMAGGEGRRLKPFTNIFPKPLVPIDNKPVIQHIMEKYSSENNINFYISVNYKSAILKSFFKSIKNNHRIKFIEETKPLGTAGALSLMNYKNKQPLLVTNCDTLIDIDLNDLLNFHKVKKNNITIVSSHKEIRIPYGTFEFDKNNFLKKIIEKPKLNFFINIGLYVLDGKILKSLAKGKYLDMTDLISDMKNKKKQIGVYPIEKDAWMDVGEWSEYKKASDKMV